MGREGKAATEHSYLEPATAENPASSAENPSWACPGMRAVCVTGFPGLRV